MAAAVSSALSDKAIICLLFKAVIDLNEEFDEIIENLLDDSSYNVKFWLLATKGIREDIPKIDQYCEKTLRRYTEDRYKDIFRMKPQTIDALVDELEEFHKKPKGVGRPAVPLQKQVLVALNFLAHKPIYKESGEKFGVSFSTSHDGVKRICNMINHNLLEKYIKWPTVNQQKETAQFYQDARGFPGVIGSLDGTHINISCPSRCQADYYNRHQKHSIILQATANEELLFTSIDVGFPGRAHDSRVFKNSALFFTSGESVQHLVSSRDYHLLADCAYPLKEYIMTPFRDNGHLTPAQTNYNTKLSSARSDVERAFGLLKGRWRKLKLMEVMSPEIATLFVTTACILHNFCILRNDLHEEEDSDDDDEDDDDDDNVLNDHLGAVKRQRIMRML